MSNLSKAFAFSCLFILSACGGSGDDQSTALNQGPLVDMPLSSTINNVQPFTGIVTWIDYWNADSIETTAGNTQLEFKYVKYSEIVSQEDQYDWTAVESVLNEAASRNHQAIVRFYYTYPADTRGGVPDYILNTTGYNGVTANSEGSPTKFPDWSSTELQEFTLEFYTAFAERYDDDPRLAFLQVGFGLWAEYHIYDGPNTLGAQFPSKGYQAQFIKHLANAFQNLRWSISKDAGSSDYSDIATTDALQNVVFGLFDDSFMHQTHDQYNRDMLLALRYEPRYEVAPIGGEFSLSKLKRKFQSINKLMTKHCSQGELLIGYPLYLIRTFFLDIFYLISPLKK